MTGPSVFISYSHDSPEHANRVLALANRLVNEGIDVILDQYEISPTEGWPRWMDRHIRSADFVLMVCTETYFRRVMGEEKSGIGLGVKWEGNLIYQHIYNANTTNSRFIPLLFNYSKVEHIPTPLQGATHYWVGTSDGYEELYRRITDQPRVKKPKLGTAIDKKILTPDDILKSVKDETKGCIEKIKNLLSSDEYKRAIIECEKILAADPINPVINLLYAIATLKGKGADSFSPAAIKRIEGYLKVACLDSEISPTALIVWGLIKFDYLSASRAHQEPPSLADLKSQTGQNDMRLVDMKIVRLIKSSKSAYRFLDLMWCK